MSAGVARNAPCACGSGRKAKRCHPAGYDALSGLRARLGTVAPMTGAERATWRATGCPHAACGSRDVDDPDAWQLGGCAAGCGV